MGSVILKMLISIAEKHPELLEGMIEDGVKLLASELKKKAAARAVPAA